MRDVSLSSFVLFAAQVPNFPSSGQPLKLLFTAASRLNQTSGRLGYY